MKPPSPCFPIQFETTDRCILDGLWFGPKNPKRVIIFIHGLTSSAFNHNLVSPLVSENTAVITFNNRGHNVIANIKQIDKRKKKGIRRKLAGMAHEVFTECVHDIAGAVDFAKRTGAAEIYLVGHSTGCQKSIYYLSRRDKQKEITGAVLLCPISDYAHIKKSVSSDVLNKVTEYAEKLINEGKEHSLIFYEDWPYTVDAQRFMSLYTSDSTEELFPYSQPNKEPKLLKKVKTPMLIVFAEKDEVSDRPTAKLLTWFQAHVKSGKQAYAIIKEANHSFTGKEEEVVNVVRLWLRDK